MTALYLRLPITLMFEFHFQKGGDLCNLNAIILKVFYRREVPWEVEGLLQMGPPEENVH